MWDYFIVRSLKFAYFNFYFAILVVKHPVVWEFGTIMDILPEIKIEESNIDVTIESQNKCITDNSCNSEKPTDNDFEANIDAITNIKTEKVNL